MRIKRSKRRHATNIKRIRLLQISEYSDCPGPYRRTAEYWGKDENFARNPGRGKASKYLKRCSNKKLRKCNEVLSGSEYKKVFDYWWALT